jgi:hypothetical protein
MLGGLPRLILPLAVREAIYRRSGRRYQRGRHQMILTAAITRGSQTYRLRIK